jgi:precorrin-3B synthase
LTVKLARGAEKRFNNPIYQEMTMTPALAEQAPDLAGAPPDRRGACPTLARPMQTGDGLLARLRPVDNVLPLAQLRALADAAVRFGNGIVEITARGSLQVRGVKPDTVALLENAVFESGMDVSAGVGVETPPLAGLDPDELVDVRPLAAELRRRVALHVPPLVLAPKLAITLSGGGQFHIGGVAADIKADAFRDEDGIKFLVSVGGRAFDVVGMSQLVEAVVRVLEKLSDIGPTARGKDVQFLEIEAPDISRVAAPIVGIFQLDASTCGLPPSVLPDISPSRGEIDPGLGSDCYLDGRVVGDQDASSQSPPLRGRCPAGQRGVSPEDSQYNSPVVTSDADDVVLGIALPYRQVDSATLISFAKAAESLGAGDIRLAPNHGLFVTGLNPQAARQLQQAAALLGLVTDPDDPRRSIALCAGSRGCASAFCDTQNLAAKPLAHAPDLLDGSLTIHLSGCAKGCAHPSPASITLVGTRSGYGLVVNGAASASSAAYIAENDIETAFQRLQALVRQRKEDQETACACLERLGEAAIAAALQLDGT